MPPRRETTLDRLRAVPLLEGCTAEELDRIATLAEEIGRTGAPAAYTPRHLAEMMLTPRAARAGERKQVTVLFADSRSSPYTTVAGIGFSRGAVRVSRESTRPHEW